MLTKKLNSNGHFEPTAPGYKFIKSQRSLGYKPRAALADLGDNSLDAKAKNIWIETTSKDKRVHQIFIIDNGTGMDFDTLYGSFKLGYERDRTLSELGKFGIGGTIGCLSMASVKLTVTRDQSGQMFARKYDLNTVKQQDQWGSTPVDVEPWMKQKLDSHVGKDNSGTMIILSNLDKLNQRKDNLDRSIINHFEKVYCEYIANDLLKIKVNDKEVESKDPLFRYHPDVKVLEDKLIEGTNIRLRIVDVSGIPNTDINLSRGQGGYVFRSNRMIQSTINANDTWSTIPTPHADFRHCRWGLYYDAEHDEDMNTDAQKSSVNPSQSLKDKIGRMVMVEAAILRKKAQTSSSKITDDEKKHQQEKRAQNLSSLPKKVEFEKPTLDETTGEKKVVNINKKKHQSLHIPHDYSIKEERLGSGSEFAIIDKNPDQNESKYLIRLNLEHSYMVKHYNNSGPKQRQVINVWVTAYLMTILSQSQTNIDLDDLKAEFSRSLNQITRLMD